MQETPESDIPIGRQPSKLYKLFFNKLPDYQKQSPNAKTLDVPRLSKDIGVSTQNIYRWLRNNELPARRQKQIVGLEGSQMTHDDLLPYITSD